MTNKSIDRALPVLINGFITLAVAWPLAHRLGIAGRIDALTLQLGQAGIALVLAWYAVIFVTLAMLLRGTALLLGLRFMAGNGVIDRLGQISARPARAIGSAIGTIANLLIFTPLQIGYATIWKPLEDRLLDLMNEIEIERQLRAEYRMNFRDQFRTFGEFKRAYYGETKSPAPAGDSLTDALALLGLAKDCTREELEVQHRKLIKKLHPDAGGTTALAAKINEAKATIMKEKAWKK